jgi:hypothetical protein
MKQSLCSEKFETFEIWAMFTLEGPHIVMSRTDAQNGLDFHFNFNYFFLIFLISLYIDCFSLLKLLS